MDTVVKDVQENPLGYEKVGSLLRKYAIPCIIAMLVSALYNIVDQIFIGQGLVCSVTRLPMLLFPYPQCVSRRRCSLVQGVRPNTAWSWGLVGVRALRRWLEMPWVFWPLQA